MQTETQSVKQRYHELSITDAMIEGRDTASFSLIAETTFLRRNEEHVAQLRKTKLTNERALTVCVKQEHGVQ